MDNAELEALMTEAAAFKAELQANLDRLRPALLDLKEIYTANIAAISERPTALFMWLPEFSFNQHKAIPSRVAKKCSQAVLRVLRLELAKVNKALGVKS